ncbi:MAG: sigma-70 family RNA polymerase sigma factor [Ruminiclostridium sp.]|nr:sigma-70 family RNA polymerase sigma factor [Ruminiclostridium sp.]
MDRYIQAHGQRLFGLCLTLCAHRQDAEDLYQDTWLKALAHFHQYDPARPFEPWLTRICVNTYRNTLRRLARSPIFHGFRTGEEKEALLASVPAPSPSDYTPLYQAVAGLPEKLRVTVILYYFEENDVNTTAQVLGIPPGTVKSRLNKARTKMKEVLDDDTIL